MIKKDIIILYVLILFVVFHIAKINGYFDFTGDDYIKRIESAHETCNLQLMLDGEYGTNWGGYWNSNHGSDNFVVEFRRKVFISEMEMSCPELPDRLEIQLYFSELDKWITVDYELNGAKYTLLDSFATDAVKVKIPEDIGETLWHVAELDFVLEAAE